MRGVLALLLVAGCTKLFNLQHIDPGRDGGADGPTDGSVDAPKLNTCVSDDFNNGVLNPAVYTITQPTGGSINANNGGIIISWPANQPLANYGSMALATPLDLRGGDATIELDAFSGDTDDAELDLQLDDAHQYLIAVNPGNVEFDLYDGDARTYSVVGQTVNTALPLTLRISHDLGTNMVTYSVMRATNTYSIPIPLAFTLQSVTVIFAGGTYAASSTVGNAKFDNLVVRSPFCL